MGGFGGYYKGEQKKAKKEKLQKQALKIAKIQSVPKVEIIGRKGK